MDVLKTLDEKGFWGVEFLTWLWYLSEESGGEVEAPGLGQVSLWIEDRLVLESLDSESKENILKAGDVSRSAEAAAALSVGKKVREARFGLIREDRQWSFLLKADTFDYASMKIPTVLSEDDDDPHATFLIRMGHVRECMDVVDRLFGRYVAMRSTGEWERQTLADMSRWVSDKTGG